ncbi:MAG: 2-oxoacid:acceptor oxidoreductase family protein [Dethiosulfatibacter sp.]|nr:2-oxoacid:acceptor oxidoreductase family protein [Dethiosulfatibacter sp.]
MKNKMSIRMSGLGGQGVVTAAHILGAATTRDGKFCTVNPFFGAEKRLAPAESYVRISSEKIYERGEILSPNIIMVFHPHVITMGKCYTMPFFEGLQKDGKILINSDEPLDLSQEELNKLNQLDAKIYYVPATKIAADIGGTELSTNMAMLGGLMGITDLVSYGSIQVAITERFDGGNFVASATTAVLDNVLKSKYKEITQLVKSNMKVMEEAASTVKEFIFSSAI